MADDPGSGTTVPRLPTSFLPPLVDVVIAGGLLLLGSTLAIGYARITAEFADDFESPETWVILLSISVVIAPIALRRIFPLGSLLVISVGMLLTSIYGVVEITATTVSALVGLISAGIYGRESIRDWARGLFALSIGATYVAAFVTSSGFNTENISPRLMVAVAAAEVVVNAGFVVFGWYMGNAERRRRAVEAQLAERNTELQAALAKVDSQAANEERLSIARDVHDIVGHTVSLLGVQAAAARRHVAHEPDTAESILEAMEDQSRGAVDEIRSLITVLRAPTNKEGSTLTMPTPSFSHLDDLIDQVRASGTDVAYSRQGPAPANSGLGLSIYRVVQEALSNAIRHGDGNVEVVVHSDADEIRIFVSNDVTAVDLNPGSGRMTPGSGLAGMEERVGLHGGTFLARRNQEGRFDVTAVLPMDPVVDLTAERSQRAVGDSKQVAS